MTTLLKAASARLGNAIRSCWSRQQEPLCYCSDESFYVQTGRFRRAFTTRILLELPYLIFTILSDLRCTLEVSDPADCYNFCLRIA